MKTEVLLEQISDHRFRATGSGRFALSVEGESRNEALTNFQKAATALVPEGAEMVAVEVPYQLEQVPQRHPWEWFAGIAKNDPLYEMFLEQIEINRRLDDENEARKLAS